MKKHKVITDNFNRTAGGADLKITIESIPVGIDRYSVVQETLSYMPDGVGKNVELSIEIRDMILDMRKSMYTEKDMKSFAEYYVQELNSVRKILPDCAASDLLFNEWKTKCQKS